ncbi:MAG: hypothetical protein RLZZ504_575 [Bacteroidota bacterium]|jgi:hypothetical protein
MESNNSSLRAVLNNIASIQHELANRQTQSLDSDILMQLKGLAAQLYLESDIELLSLSDEDLMAEPTPVAVPEAVPAAVPEAVPVPVPVVEVAPVVKEAPVEEVVPAFIPAVEEVVPVVEVSSVVEVVPVVEVAPVIETAPVVETPVVEVAPVVEVPPVLEVVPVVETPKAVSHSGKTVDGVIAEMPLSRRFEFANILFGGDMQKMGMFIQQFIDAPNASGRLDVYDQWYEERQWRRRDESASDMLRMLKRMFAS